MSVRKARGNRPNLVDVAGFDGTHGDDQIAAKWTERAASNTGPVFRHRSADMAVVQPDPLLHQRGLETQ